MLMDTSNFGMLKEPPTSLVDAIKQILIDPNLLALFAITFVVALVLPLAVSIAVRKWNQAKLRKFKKPRSRDDVNDDDEQTDASMKLPNGMVGSFNKSILDCFRKGNNQRDMYDDDETSPFVSRNNLTLKEEDIDILSKDGEKLIKQCKDNHDDDDDLFELESVEDDTKPQIGNETKRKARKKYKDPDPETAEALNKLIEQGLHGKLATAQLRAKTQVLEERMTDEERTNEAQVRQKQLEKIFEMMEGQKDKFGINEKEELAEQMKLYSI